MKKTILLVIIIFAIKNINAQSQKIWTLRQCVDYAIKNNISVKQADIQARIAALQLKQAQYYQLPSASFSTGLYPQFGRTIDRTTNSYSNTSIVSQNYSLQGSVEIYSWGKLKNNIAASTFNAKAALADIEKTANDVALNVATYYLQILASYQQIKIAEVQITTTKNNLNATRKKVDAGSLPELNALEFESQLAVDSNNLVSAITSYSQTLLALKGVLNIDAALPFEVEIPNIDKIPLENLLELQPENVYKLALDNQPSIKANKLRINASEKNTQASKAALLPSISGSYSLGTNYTNRAEEITGVSIKPTIIGNVNVAGNNYDVFTNYPEYSTAKSKYFSQLSNNFGQNLGVNISVPIFNYGANKINYEQSKLNLQNTKILEEQIEQKLKLDIYTAYSNAVNAFQKFNASKKQVELAQKTFDFANKRYDVGLLNTIDLITNQNNLLRAKTQNLADQYDYVFKMKLLEFYKGQGLKL
ncbi:MAG: TolC family protein [Chitinophagaceae bacterium]